MLEPMETPTPAEPQGQDCPQCGYCVSGSAKQGRCPECGSTLTHWTTRWRASDVASGLELLAWGLPLLLVAFAAATVCRWIGDSSNSAFFELDVLSPLLLILCVVPSAMSLIAVLQLRMARSSGVRLTVALVFGLLVCLALAIRFGHHRLEIGKDSNGDWYWAMSWGDAIGTVSTVLMFVGGVLAATFAGRVLLALGREFHLRLRLATVASQVFLWIAISLPLLDDAWQHLKHTGPSANQGGLIGVGVVWSHPSSLGRHDPYSVAAGILGIVVLWVAVMLVRARLRGDLRHASSSTIY